MMHNTQTKMWSANSYISSLTNHFTLSKQPLGMLTGINEQVNSLDFTQFCMYVSLHNSEKLTTIIFTTSCVLPTSQ